MANETFQMYSVNITKIWIGYIWPCTAWPNHRDLTPAVSIEGIVKIILNLDQWFRRRWRLKKFMHDRRGTTDKERSQWLTLTLWLRWAKKQANFPACKVFVCLIWFFMSQSTIFQLCEDGPSWLEPVLSKDKCVLLKDTTRWRWWGSNLPPLGH